MCVIPVTIKTYVEEIALKGVYGRAELNAIRRTWFEDGTVSRELPGIGYRENVFPPIAAVLSFQAGLMGVTPQLTKVW